MFRHFATAGNLEKRYIGTTDEPILPVSSVSGVPEVEIVLASPLLRCRETAGLLYPRLDPVLIEGFRECDFGAFEGKNYRELTGDQDYQAWIDSGGILPFPGGESMASFYRADKGGLSKSGGRSDGRRNPAGGNDCSWRDADGDSLLMRHPETRILRVELWKRMWISGPYRGRLVENREERV